MHLAIQGLSGKPWLASGDLRWLALGTIVPDLPWILQRALRTLAEPDLIALRAYCVGQSSLLLSWVLCAALALLAPRPGRAFGWLASATAVHLVLDAVQHKWGNAVLFLAPFSWASPQFGWFWPENPVVALLSIAGVGTAILLRRGDPPGPLRPAVPRLAGALLLFALYAVLPFSMISSAISSNVHYLDVLREPGTRPGHPIAFDRVDYRATPGRGAEIRAWNGEIFRVSEGGPPSSAMLSLKGRFEAPDVIEIEAYHRHHPYARQVASLIGLALVAWIAIPFPGRSRPREALHSAP